MAASIAHAAPAASGGSGSVGGLRPAPYRGEADDRGDDLTLSLPDRGRDGPCPPRRLPAPCL
jgi:hypothetical protein